MHAWRAEVNDDGESFKACARCNAAEDLYDLTDGSGSAALGPSGSGF
jgi:hypothetical protein